MARKNKLRKKKNDNKFNVFNVIIGLLILVVVGVIANQSYTLAGEEAFLPDYWTAECVERAESMSQVQITSHTDDGKFYECTSDFSGTWIPEVNGIQCEFQVKNANFGTTAYVCDLDANNFEDSSCVKKTGILSSGEDETFIINVNKKVWIDSNRVSAFGKDDADLFARYPSYGLRVRLDNGFVEATTTDCIANSIESVTQKQTHPLNLNGKLVVVPGAPFNAVTGNKRGISTQLVNLKDVENGNTIYISRPGFYFKTARAEDDFLYVDVKREYSNSLIECIPRTAGCSDDAKIVKLEDQSCDSNTGAITSYAPVEGDTTRLCKYECAGGSLDLTSECISVETSCPQETPLWDARTGDCVRVSEAPSDDDTTDLLLVYVLIGALASIVILLTIKMLVDRGGKK